MSLNFGTKLGYGSNTSRAIKSVWLSDALVFMLYYDTTIATTRVITANISGTTITYNNQYACPAGLDSSIYNGICKIDDTHVLIVYIDTNNYLWSVIATISSGVISWGTPVKFTAGGYGGANYYLPIKKINNNTFIVSFFTYHAVYALAIQISGSTITFGTAVQINTQNLNGQYVPQDLAIINDSTFAIFIGVYQNSGGYYAVCTLSGTTITKGTTTQFDSGTVCGIQAIQIDSSHVAIILDRQTSYVYLYIGTISGSTITVGTIQNLYAYPNKQAYIGYNLIKTADNNFIFVIKFSQYGQYYGYAYPCTVSGTVITIGNPVTFNSTDVTYLSIDNNSNTSKIVIGYIDKNGVPTLIIGTTGIVSVSNSNFFLLF